MPSPPPSSPGGSVGVADLGAFDCAAEHMASDERQDDTMPLDNGYRPGSPLKASRVGLVFMNLSGRVVG
jgi:hypothetical protein